MSDRSDCTVCRPFPFTLLVLLFHLFAPPLLLQVRPSFLLLSDIRPSHVYKCWRLGKKSKRLSSAFYTRFPRNGQQHHFAGPFARCILSFSRGLLLCSYTLFLADTPCFGVFFQAFGRHRWQEPATAASSCAAHHTMAGQPPLGVCHEAAGLPFHVCLLPG